MPRSCLDVPHYQQVADHTCLPACVRMVLAYHGLEKSEEDLADLLDTDFTGTPAARVHCLEGLGFLTVLHEACWEDLQRYVGMGLPCIALVYTIHFPHYAAHPGGNHTVVVAGIGRDTVLIHDPLQPSGPVAIPRASFEAAWEARRNRLIVIARVQTSPVTKHA